MPNNRIYYAIQQLGFAPLGSTTFTEAHGVQSCGVSTTFPLDKVNELGQLATYEIIEGIPDIEVTLEKVLDGYCPTYLLATENATAATLAGRSAVKTIVGFSIFADTSDSATGTPIAQITMSGMAVSSVGYNVAVGQSATESLTLVGNDKVWRHSGFTFNGAFTTNADEPLAIAGSGGVSRQEDVIFAATGIGRDSNGQCTDIHATILPRNVPGISSSGTNDKSGDDYKCHIQSINVSADFGREAIFELGRKAPYFRYITFPVDVTCDIELISISGDWVNAQETTSQSPQTINLALREGTRINLGTKNKLASVSYNGGDTGGGNVTMTFSYQNQSTLTVQHWNDETSALRTPQVIQT